MTWEVALVSSLLLRVCVSQPPDALWRFEDPQNIGTDSSATATHAFTVRPLSPLPSPPYEQRTSGGCVGGYLHVGGENTALNLFAEAVKPLPTVTAPGLTLELLFRTADPNLANSSSFGKAGNTSLLRGGNGEGAAGWELVFDRHAIRFRAAGRVVSAALVGTGVRSIWNLADGKWHHLVCRLDAASGEQSIWVDGQCPHGPNGQCPRPNEDGSCADGTEVYGGHGSHLANTSTAPGHVPAGSGSVVLLPDAFDGDLDEIAVYSAALSNGSIWAHFQTATTQHAPYTFAPVVAPAPPPHPASGSLHETDFPNGTVLPTPAGNSSCSASTMWLPLDQLKAYPAPKFLRKPATGPTIGTLQRNFNWMDPSYMSGSPFRHWGQDVTWYEPQIQEELAKTFHYNLQVGAMGRGRVSAADPDARPDEMTSILFGIADANPDYGIDTIFQRMGAKYCTHYDANSSLETGCEAGWRYTNQSLNIGCYLADKDGNFLTLTGAKAVPNPKTGKTPKVLRPTTPAAATANNCPDTIFSAEWEYYATMGRFRKAGFSGTVSRINNDGEYNVIYMHAATTFDPATNSCVYDKDPKMLADYKTSGIPPKADGSPDWYTFVSRWRARFSTQFSKALTSDPNSPELKGALFTEYQIQGTNLFMGAWNETRVINTPRINGGKLRYYSTGDFYPWVQGGRRVHAGPYHNISMSLEYGVPSWDVSHGSYVSVHTLHAPPLAFLPLQPAAAAQLAQNLRCLNPIWMLLSLCQVALHRLAAADLALTDCHGRRGLEPVCRGGLVGAGRAEHAPCAVAGFSEAANWYLRVYVCIC